MAPALCSDIILNFHHLAPRLNHLSLHQLKRNSKIFLTNLLKIAKKAVVLKNLLHVVKKAIVLIVVVKYYRLTHNEATSNVNRNQVDWLCVTLWKTDMIFPQKISTLLNICLNNRKFYTVVEYFLQPWFNFKCDNHHAITRKFYLCVWNTVPSNQLIRKTPSRGLFLFKTLSNTSTPFNPSFFWKKKQRENQ